MQTDEHMVANETLVFSEKKIPLLVLTLRLLFIISAHWYKKNRNNVCMTFSRGLFSFLISHSSFFVMFQLYAKAQQAKQNAEEAGKKANNSRMEWLSLSVTHSRTLWWCWHLGHVTPVCLTSIWQHLHSDHAGMERLSLALHYSASV